MSKYQAYPQYKDSGFGWLGNIPTHWVVSPIKWQIEKVSGGAWGQDPNGVEDTFVLRSTEQTHDGEWKIEDPASRRLSPQEAESTLLKEDDLLMTKSSGSSLHIGKTTIVTGEIAKLRCGYSNFMQRIRIKEDYIARFYWYIFNNELARKQLDYLSSSTTGLANLNATVIGEIICSNPPKVEQEKIANFLDHETAKIDTLIDKQQQLIQLLKEKRQAVISHAVTKGLNPNAPMRDSGVEWLGEVPEHWKVSSLGYYATISTGATPDRSNPKYWDGNIPWVKTGEVKYEDILKTEEYITPHGVMGSAVTISPPGTLLMAMYGQGVTRGRVALLGIHATYNQACAAITPNMEIWNQYLRYFFMAAYHAIRDGGNETSQMNLSSELVGKFKITIPIIVEQYKIVDFLHVELEKIDLLIDKAVHGVELMHERRTALISAAVTGKIDVRHPVCHPTGDLQSSKSTVHGDL